MKSHMLSPGLGTQTLPLSRHSMKTHRKVRSDPQPCEPPCHHTVANRFFHYRHIFLSIWQWNCFVLLIDWDVSFTDLQPPSLKLCWISMYHFSFHACICYTCSKVSLDLCSFVSVNKVYHRSIIYLSSHHFWHDFIVIGIYFQPFSHKSVTFAGLVSC